MSDEYDYEEALKRLNDETDPERCEELAQEILENEILKLPPDRQLKARQFQWKVIGPVLRQNDQKAKIGELFGMAWDSFLRLDKELGNLKESLQACETEFVNRSTKLD